MSLFLLKKQLFSKKIENLLYQEMAIYSRFFNINQKNIKKIKKN